MKNEERLESLIDYLLSENKNNSVDLSKLSIDEKQRLFRSLVNIRNPKPLPKVVLQLQDDYLSIENECRGVFDCKQLFENTDSNIALWRGDITTLKCDAIVNAANSSLLGCFCPCHGCIDNAIHTFSGVQLRLECADIMKNQRKEEPVGNAKITKAYSLPCKNIIHTVGPYISGQLSDSDCNQLASCYESCLELADANNLKTIAFCCISTGEFNFPNETAAKIAVSTVINYISKNTSNIKVIFNVFKEYDEQLYTKLLTKN